MSSIDKLLTLLYHLFIKASSWFPIDGSISMRNPRGMSFSFVHVDRNSKCELNLANLSYFWFSFNPSFSLLLFRNWECVFSISVRLDDEALSVETIVSVLLELKGILSDSVSLSCIMVGAVAPLPRLVIIII